MSITGWMRRVEVPVRAMLVGAVLSAGAGGCAAGARDRGPGEASNWVMPTNTAAYKEHVVTRTWEKTTGAEAHAILPAAILVGALRFALPLFERLIRDAGAGFEAKTTGLAHVDLPEAPQNLATRSRTMNGQTQFLFARVIEVPQTEFERDPELQKLELNSTTLASFSESLAKACSGMGGPSQAELQQALAGIIKANPTAATKPDEASKPEKGVRYALAFALVGDLTPRKGGETFHVRLLAGTFSARKAKALRGGLSAVDKRDDTLAISLARPLGSSPSPTGVTVAFQIRAAEGPLKLTTYSSDARAVQSAPIMFEPFRTTSLGMSFVETSDFKRLLDKAADEIAKLKPEQIIEAF